MRYRTPTIQAAIIQKLARIISGLHASSILLSHGIFQELGALFRTLDEFREDALFLGQAAISGETTPSHEEYLSAFYQEEFANPDDPSGSPQKCNQVSRKRIHAAIGQISENPVNPSDSQSLNRTLHQAISGYVHGASHHIMETYTGNPPRLHLTGMLRTPLEPLVQSEALQYFHRGLRISMILTCKARFTDLEATSPSPPDLPPKMRKPTMSRGGKTCKATCFSHHDLEAGPVSRIRLGWTPFAACARISARMHWRVQWVRRSPRSSGD